MAGGIPCRGSQGPDIGRYVHAHAMYNVLVHCLLVCCHGYRRVGGDERGGREFKGHPGHGDGHFQAAAGTSGAPPTFQSSTCTL